LVLAGRVAVFPVDDAPTDEAMHWHEPMARRTRTVHGTSLLV